MKQSKYALTFARFLKCLSLTIRAHKQLYELESSNKEHKRNRAHKLQVKTVALYNEVLSKLQKAGIEP